MNQSTQQKAREVIRSQVEDFIKNEIRRLVSHSQSIASADKVFADFWPDLDPKLVIKLVSADPDYLICSDAIPDCIQTVIFDEFLKCNHPTLEELSKKNFYARGEKRKKLVREAVKARIQTARDQANQLFDKIKTDRLACPKAVRSRVILLLNNRCIDELIELDSIGSSADETGAKRRLKVLTALSIPDANSNDILNAIKQIGDGRTAGFPYVLKYLSVDHIPTQPRLPCSKPATSSCITAELERLIPEAIPLKLALQSYLEQGGVISKFLNSGGDVAEAVKDRFEKFPAFIPADSGILLPKQDALVYNREKRYVLPDGIVCTIALTILLESILRQIQTSLKIDGSHSLRPKELIGRINKVIHFSSSTIKSLDVIFGTSQIALRDAVAHGVFVANDAKSITEIVAGLAETVELVMNDLACANKEADFFASSPWSKDYKLGSSHENTFREQFENCNMVTDAQTPEIQTHALRVIRVLIPDKAPMCRASGLIWPNLGNGKTLDGHLAAEFIGIVGGLMSLEELFRAAQEVYGQRILWPSQQSNGLVKCHFSMLDDSACGILNPSNIKRLFGAAVEKTEFLNSVKAVRALRDNIMHGGWGGLSQPKEHYLHLIMKLIYTICSTIEFDESENPVPINGRTN